MRFRKPFLPLLALSSLFLMTACGRSTANQMNYPAMTTAGSAYTSTQPATGAYSYPAPQNAIQNSSAQPVQGGRAVATANGYVYQQDPNASSNGYDFYNKQNPCLFSKPGQSVQCNGADAYYGNQQTAARYPTTPAYPATPQTTYPTTNAAYPANNTYGNTSGYVAPATQANPYAAGNTYTQQRALPQPVSRPMQAVARPVQQTQAPATIPTNAQSTASSRLAPAGTNTGSAPATGGESKPKVTF